MIEKFIRDYAQRGYDFACRLSGNSEEARELVQESFYRVIRNWDQYDPSQPLENWFFTILRNLYYDGLRRYERRQGVSLDAPLNCAEGGGLTFADTVADDRDEELLDRLTREETAEEVRAALGRLSAEYRAVLTMVDAQGLSYEEVATVLDCPVGTVRSRLSRARGAFRRALIERGCEVVKS